MNLSLRLAAALTLFATPCAADLITGRVVDSFGNPVSNVNLDVESLTGPDPDPMNDFTDLAGNFATTIPSGVYRVIFNPPDPPVTTHLRVELENVVVVGTADLGTIVLPPGVGISGRLVSPGGLPVGDADIDAVDPLTGEDVPLASDNVDAFGNFNLAVPADLILQFEPRPPLIGQLYAPRELELSLAGSTNLGDIVVQPGVEITGTVLGGGLPVPQVDFDVVDSVTGEELFTPADNTDALGAFRLVVPVGNYDFEVCPPPATRFLATRAASIPINASVDVGTIPLTAGALMSGTVTDCQGRPIPGVDVDVLRQPSLSPVFLCADTTDETGFYEVVVPFALQAVVFEHPVFGVQGIPGLNPLGDFVQNGMLDCCPPGSAILRNGSGSNPILFQAASAPGIGDPWQVSVDTSGRPAGVLAIFGYGGGGSGIFVPGSGEILIDPGTPQLFVEIVNHGGAPTNVTFPIPDTLELCGAQATTQALVFGGPDPIFTNAVDVVMGE